MKKIKMKLTVSKRIIKAGDIVEVTWDAGEGTSPRLIMHTGNRETALAVPDSGSKKFRLKNVKGKHWIGLRCWVGKEEKIIKHRVFLYGKAKDTDEFEYMSQDSWFSRQTTKLKRFWSAFPSDKKRLYIILLMLIGYQIILGLGLYSVSQIVLTLITFYLFWQIIKR